MSKNIADVSRRALNYDLDDNKLKLYYPNPKSYKNAWRDIKGYLCKNGFESRQYSGVVSKDSMSMYEVGRIIKKLDLKFPWLAQCVLKFDVTNVGNTYSLINKFGNNEINKYINNSLNDSKNIEFTIENINKELKELGIGNNNFVSYQKDITKGNEL